MITYFSTLVKIPNCNMVPAVGYHAILGLNYKVFDIPLVNIDTLEKYDNDYYYITGEIMITPEALQYGEALKIKTIYPTRPDIPMITEIKGFKIITEPEVVSFEYSTGIKEIYIKSIWDK